MHYDQLFEGCFIVSDYNSLKQRLVGVIQNLTPDGEETANYDRKYEIFFPELNEQKKSICFGSGVTEEAVFLPKEEALKLLNDLIPSYTLDIQDKKISISKIEIEIAEFEKRKIYIENFLTELEFVK